MHAEYPNLPLIEERFRNLIEDELEAWKEDLYGEELIEKYSVEVFEQSWPNTNGGFHLPERKSEAVPTTQYTTVIHEHATDIYGVFFGNRAGYLVKRVNYTFMRDLCNRSMKDEDNALEYYDGTEAF